MSIKKQLINKLMPEHYECFHCGIVFHTRVEGRFFLRLDASFKDRNVTYANESYYCEDCGDKEKWQEYECKAQ